MVQTCQIYLLSLELTKSNCTHSKQTLPVPFMGLLKFFTKWNTSNLSAELLNSNTSAATSNCYGHVVNPPTRGHALGPAVSTSNHISCGKENTFVSTAHSVKLGINIIDVNMKSQVLTNASLLQYRLQLVFLQSFINKAQRRSKLIKQSSHNWLYNLNFYNNRWRV